MSITRLGKCVRTFASRTCSAFNTKELPTEETARRRRTAPKDPKAAPTTGKGPKTKKFNLSTYKLHALGDYVNAIRRFGTTDNYSTQTVSSLSSVALHVATHCPRASWNIAESSDSTESPTKSNSSKGLRSVNDESDFSSRCINSERITLLATTTSPSHRRSNITICRHQRETITTSTPSLATTRMTQRTRSVPILITRVVLMVHSQNFISHLKDHVLGRLGGDDYDGDETEFSADVRRRVFFVKNRIYFHKAIRFNYTTYDMRRDQDSINPRTHANVLVLSHEDSETNRHPYWYARVIHVLHVFVQVKKLDGTLTAPKKMDVLRVRWFGRNLNVKTGWKAKRLHQIGFIPATEPGAFGFLNPDVVIRGVHLMPRFATGRTTTLLGPSIIRNPSENNEDWWFYYVGM